MTCLITIKCVYGVNRAYPANETATLLASLVGQKTFDSGHLAAIRALGYHVEVVTPELEVG